MADTGVLTSFPLSGVTKRGVRAIAAHLEAREEPVFKTDALLRPDEDVCRVTYDEIDGLLERKAAEGIMLDGDGRYVSGKPRTEGQKSAVDQDGH